MSTTHRSGPPIGPDHPSGRTTKTNDDVETAVAANAVDVVAGTAWLFAREAMAGAIDMLVVDEAGQLSLADVLAVAPADEATVPQHLGLFLYRSWRLHPEICGFISEQVYDGRLQSEDRCALQSVDDGPIAGGAGSRRLRTEHEGSRTSSTEETEAVARLFEALVGRGWTDHDGARAPLGAPDRAAVRVRQRCPERCQLGLGVDERKILSRHQCVPFVLGSDQVAVGLHRTKLCH
ncbi:MAG: hypothetical protein ACP5P1_14165 [Acidimicrobiales bacterium]